MVYEAAHIPAKNQIAIPVTVAIGVYYFLKHLTHLNNLKGSKRSIQFVQNPRYRAFGDEFGCHNSISHVTI